MGGLPPVSTYQPQSRRTQKGNGMGAGVARPIDKKRHVESDESNSSKHQKSKQSFKKHKKEETVELDFSDSEPGSSNDFNPTLKAWRETNVGKNVETVEEKQEEWPAPPSDHIKIGSFSISKTKDHASSLVEESDKMQREMFKAAFGDNTDFARSHRRRQRRSDYFISSPKQILEETDRFALQHKQGLRRSDGRTITFPVKKEERLGSPPPHASRK